MASAGAQKAHGPSTSARRPGPDATESRGWRFDVTGWSHVVELGFDVLGLDHPRTVYLDDRPVATMPLLPPSRGWEAVFTVDGRPAEITGRMMSLSDDLQTRRWWYRLEVDGIDLGGPTRIVGRADRPAVGTSARRRRRTVARFIGWVLLGAVVGAAVPLAPRARLGEMLIALVALLVLAGVVLVPVCLVRVWMGRSSRADREILLGLLPFDVGLVLGAVATGRLGVGSDVDATNIAIWTVAVVLGLVLLAVGLLGLWEVTSPGEPGRPLYAAGRAIGALGFIVTGISFTLGGALIALGGAADAGPMVAVMLVGIAAATVGGLLISAEHWRAGRRQPPAPSTADVDGQIAPDARSSSAGPVGYVEVTTLRGVGERVAGAAAVVCRDPETSQFAIFSGRRGFVQLAPDAEGLHVEAVSNAYLDGSQALTADEDAALRALGWPAARPDENYGRSFAEPVDLAEIASLVIASLEVYGDDPDTMEITIGPV